MIAALLVGCVGEPPHRPITDPTSPPTDTALADTALAGTGWPLDPSCLDPVSLPLDVVHEAALLRDEGYPHDHCHQLLGIHTPTPGDLEVVLGDRGLAPSHLALDWEAQQALFIAMEGCNGEPSITLTALHHCLDGRVFIDSDVSCAQNDHPSQRYWIVAVPPAVYASSVSRMSMHGCGDGQVYRFLDGVLVE